MRVIQHVQLGASRDRAWCGRYVGFHNPKPVIPESDFLERRAMRSISSVCGHCRRSFEADERKRVR